jgi:hypothetical protein
MAYYISNDYLAHYGVKGMHWGVRKSRASSGVRTRIENHKSKKFFNQKYDNGAKKASTRVNIDRGTLNSMSADADRAITGLNKLRPRKTIDLSKYSDKELQQIVNRQQLEQRYYQLNPDKIDKGAAYLREVLQTGIAVGGLYLSYKALKLAKG